MEPKNLLAIDDDPVACAYLAAMLCAKGYEVVTDTDPQRARTLLRDGDFDVVLLDLVMPGIGGLELLEEIKRDHAVPVIVVTGQGSIEKAVEAMRLGASDLITKPANAEILDVRIRRAYEHERTRRLANTDGLTGLYNHRYFQEQLAAEVDRANRYGRALSLLIVDLDHFKEFNDRFGHPAGDRALFELGKVLTLSSRSTDVVARYGGEEFAILLTEAEEEAARVVAERMRSCVAELRLEGLEHTPHARLTLSLGLCCLSESTSKDDLICQADRALYEAKRGGRNRVCVARPEGRELPAASATSLLSTAT